MSCWPSSSSRPRAAPGAILLAALLACAGARPPPAVPARARIALFPPGDESAGVPPLRDTWVKLEVALRARGVDLVSGDIVDEFLARHRLRYTAGIDRDTASAARDELGVDAVLLSSVDLFSKIGTPRYGMTMRLVSTGDDPTILWIDGTVRAGDDAPGLFGLGVVGDVGELQRLAVSRLTRSLAEYLAGRGPRARACPRDDRFAPRILYRSPLTRRSDRVSVAVLPFVNRTGSPNAGDVVASAFVRALVADGRVDVRDPGIVRGALLQNRIILEGGVSHESARVSLGSMDVDVVVSGNVRGFEDGGPSVEFTAIALDTWTNRTVWQSSSLNRGDDGVFFFGAGRIWTANALACRMARDVAEEMVRAWRKGPSPAARGESAGPRGRP